MTKGRRTAPGHAGTASSRSQQPAFARCMVQRVTEHVFPGGASPADLVAMRAAFEQGHRMKDLLRVALLRYVQSAQPAPEAASPEVPLRARLEEACGDCHTGGAHDFFNGQPVDSRDVLLKMAAKVGFLEMPPNLPLREDKRKALLTSVVSAAFPDDASRRGSLAYFEGRLRPLTVRQGDSLDHVIHEHAAVEDKDPIRDWGQVIGEGAPLNNGMATLIAHHRGAVRSCKTLHCGE